MLSHHMNSILVEAWDAFKVSARKFISYSFAKTKPVAVDSVHTPIHSNSMYIQAYIRSICDTRWTKHSHLLIR